MASYYIFAVFIPSRIFATLAATTIGVGSVGNLAGSVPLVWVVQVMGGAKRCGAWLSSVRLIAMPPSFLCVILRRSKVRRLVEFSDL